MFGALKLSYDVLEITFQQDLKTFYQDFVQDIYCPKCETKCLFYLKEIELKGLGVFAV